MDKEYAKELLKKTQEDYNLIAEDFARTRWNIWPEFSIFRDYIKDKDKILDIGCGNGRLLELLKDKNIEYIGIDNSEKLIKIAKQKYPQNKFLLADVLKLPFQEKSFDKVFLIAVLHNIPSKEFRLQILEEAKRVLKPGGILILTVWDIWRRNSTVWQLHLKNILFKFIGKSKLDFKDIFLPWKNSQGKALVHRYIHCFTKKELENLVKESGFKIKESWIWGRNKKRISNIYLIAWK